MPGTVATNELLVASVTEIPPAGAGELKNTVPVALVLPWHRGRTNCHRLQERRGIRVRTDVDKNGLRHAARGREHVSSSRKASDRLVAISKLLVLLP